MLPKKRRLTTGLFDEVIESGKVFHSPIMSLKAIKVNEGKKSLFAVVASKKYFKTAVSRNNMRRRAYAALASIMSDLDHIENEGSKRIFHCIIMMKPAALELIRPDLIEAIRNIFVKSRIIT